MDHHIRNSGQVISKAEIGATDLEERCLQRNRVSIVHIKMPRTE
jgi:hypothetical protein